MKNRGPVRAGRAVNQCEIKIGDKLNFTVPTGNFGDILAGYYAKCMGLPVNHFICASNNNKVLYDFFETGIYNKNREFHITISPSMDILISSNLERFLCHTIGQQKTKECMIKLQKEGNYSIETIQNSEISGEYATEQQTYTAIKQLYEQTGYVMDTHTAVAYAAYQKYKKETKDNTPMVIVSTASPYKFTKDVMIALDQSNQKYDAFALMEKLQKASGVKIPASIQDIERRKVLHNNVCEKQNIKEFVVNYLLG